MSFTHIQAIQVVKVLWHKARIANTHKQFNRICQVAPTTQHAPHLEHPNWHPHHTSVSPCWVALSLTTIGHVPGQPHFALKTAPLHVVHGSFGPRVHHSNGISNASAVSAQLTAVTPYNLQWATISPSKLLLHIGIWTTNTRFPGPTQVNIPNGITVSALLFQGSTVVTDRPTSHTSPSVATGHI